MIRDEVILFYDADCGFCSGIVRFLLLKDEDKKLKFAPLKGETFKAMKVPDIDDETIIVYEKAQVYYKSDAAIYALELLGGGWLVLAHIMKIFPKFFRDFVYDGIGKIRHLLRKNSCPTLPEKYQERLLP